MSKTQSKIGVTIANKVKTPFVRVYKASQNFIQGDGPTKLDFSDVGAVTNQSGGGLTTDIANDNFAIVNGSSDIWEVSYYGTAEFEAVNVLQRLTMSVYINGATANTYAYQSVTTTVGSTNTPFSGSFIMSGPPGFTIDLRFDATLGDITIKNTNLIIKCLSRLF